MTTCADIRRVVAGRYCVTEADITGPSRFDYIVEARHVALYLARKLTARGFADIGRRVANRHHSSAIYAARKIERERGMDAHMNTFLDSLELELTST